MMALSGCLVILILLQHHAAFGLKFPKLGGQILLWQYLFLDRTLLPLDH
jgi:hypothetical protein